MLDTVNTVLLAAPGALATAFALYFAYRRVFYKVLVTYSFGGGVISADGITSLTLVNRKDRPLTIFSIHAVLGNRNVIEIESFSPPLILKPLEAIEIRPRPFSAYMMGNDEYNPAYDEWNGATIWLALESRFLKCKPISSPTTTRMRHFRRLKFITKVTKQMNGVVYKLDSRYAISYGTGDDTKTAIVTKGGIITGDWGFAPNHLRETDLASEATVKAALEASGLTARLGGIAVRKLS
jgi:hypothetical protein